MKLFRLILLYTIEAIVALNMLLCLSLNIPYIQGKLGAWGSAVLSELLQTQVTIGQVDMGLLNQVIISDIHIQDQQERPMLTVQKLAGKIDLPRLLEGDIFLNTVQLIRFQANLYQEADSLPTNFQFVLNALASKDSTNQKETNVRINSLIIRDGNIAFNRLYLPQDTTKLDVNHLHIQDFNAHASIKSILRDSMDIRLRNLNFKEQSGLKINDITFQLHTTPKGALLSHFQLSLPHTHILVDTLQATYDWQAKDFLDSLHTQGRIAFSPLMLHDFKALLPAVGNCRERINIQLDIASVARNVQINKLQIDNETKTLSLLASTNATLAKDSTQRNHISATFDRIQASTPDLQTLFRDMDLGQVPQQVLALGGINLSGQVTSDLKGGSFTGKLTTDVGNVDIEATISADKEVKAKVTTAGVQLTNLVPGAGLGNLTTEISADGKILHNKFFGTLKGMIDQLEYKGYPIHDITVNADVENQGVTGGLQINDPNIQLVLNAQALTQSAIPSYQAVLNLKHLRPSVLGIQPNLPHRTFQTQVTANLEGKDLDTLEGLLKIHDFQLTDSTQTYRFNELLLSASQDEYEKRLSLYSDFLNAHVMGQYQYSTLANSVTHILHKYIPSLVEAPKSNSPTENNCSFSFNLSDTQLLQQLLGLDLTLEDPIKVSGFLNDYAETLDLQLQANRFGYNGNHFERANIVCQNNDNGLYADVHVNKYNPTSLVSLGVRAQANNDLIQAGVTWDNNKQRERFSGNLNVSSQLNKIPNMPLQASINILPSETVINDTIWHIRPAHIDIQDKLYQIHHLLIENDNHRLLVNGNISENPTDSLVAELKEIQVEYVLDAINFDAVQFGGFASGSAVASNLLNAPQADTHLFVRDFRFQTGTMGNMNLYGKWEPETDAIFMEGQVAEFDGHQQNNDTARITRVFKGLEDYVGRTHVIGRISPKYNTIDLNIDAQNTNANFLRGFVGTVFDDIEGRATGWCRLSNNLKDVDITAQLKANIDATVHALHTRYHIQADSVEFVTNWMKFRNTKVIDKDGRIAEATGNVRHWYLHRLVYDFHFTTPNLLCFDTKNFDDDDFYATAYVGGDIDIEGGPGYMRVNADVTTNPGTQFVYDASVPEEVSNTQFITFVDKTPGQQIAPVPTSSYFTAEEEEEEEKSDMNINLQIAATPDATIKVIMNRMTGDFISANGSGTLQAKFYNKGAFNMFGVYNISKGLYRMNMQEVIRKDFALQNGSNVHFNGNPFDATLDVKASYTVAAANLRDLSPTASFAQKTSTRVNCLMNIEGNLLKPSVTFGLEMPTLNEEDKSMVRSLIATDEQMNMQIIYLLGIGRFYSGEMAQEGVNQTNQAMNSILTSTLSSHFNQMLAQVVNINNWNFGANINPGQQGMNNMEFQTMLQGSLFDNRLLVNGNFGYKENNMMNRNFVGDFDVQWLLNKSGTINLKAYNETNDRYFTRNTLNTQGVGIIFKKDFDNWKHLFRRKKTE